MAWDGESGSLSSLDLNPRLADSDGDGVSDLMEIASGSDPLNSNDAAKVGITGIERQSRSSAVLSWPVSRNNQSIGVTYVVEYSADMANWTKVGELTSDGDTTMTVSLQDTKASPTGGFYRLRLEIR